ncbi:hypothetical protein TOPH_05908 [Tolypocladium ophioglossoides CBS 100239]|uniref:Uncharacterized protein n=1 Tax=Tolypocladium ophioglossoides (strain CBS 100239) TaxID=1163406 RepID=A0A0L0N648_TOLOC|nr:hypothetical protein TOPH_05908 [Tolypocladium ophioglossoides CBS 100239]
MANSQKKTTHKRVTIPSRGRLPDPLGPRLGPPLPPLPPAPFTLPSCSILKSFVSPDGVHLVPAAQAIMTLQRPLAHRCHEVVMQFHCPSEEHAAPWACALRTMSLVEDMLEGIERVAWAHAWRDSIDSRVMIMPKDKGRGDAMNESRILAVGQGRKTAPIEMGLGPKMWG